MADFAERRWTSHDGLTLFARDYAGASGPCRLPIICLHGLTRNSRDFEDVAPVLAKLQRRVIVAEMRGRGLSDRDPNPKNYNPRVYVRDVLGMMDQLGIARAVFLGTSMGGIVMMLLAARHSRRIGAAILNDVGPEVAPEGVARIKSYVGKAAPVVSWDDAVAYVRTLNEASFPHFDANDWRRFTERTFRERADGTPVLAYDPAIAVALAGGGKIPPFLAWALFRRLRRKPTLVIRGQTSDILTANTVAKMKAGARTLVTVEVPGVGHAPLLDEPAAIEAVERFLDKVP